MQPIPTMVGWTGQEKPLCWIVYVYVCRLASVHSTSLSLAVLFQRGKGVLVCPTVHLKSFPKNAKFRQQKQVTQYWHKIWKHLPKQQKSVNVVNHFRIFFFKPVKYFITKARQQYITVI